MTDTRNLTLFGQALGDGLGHFLLHKPRIGSKIHKSITMEDFRLHIGYGEHTQLSLALKYYLSTLEHPHYSAQLSSMIKERLSVFPKEDIRDGHNLIAHLSQLQPIKNESVSTSILFATLCTEFHSLEKLMPWLIGYASMLNKNTYSIAGHIFFGMYLFCRYQGATPQEFIQMFTTWRKSSQALQSPVPDQIYWAFQQALWIGISYNRRPMMEFIGQHLTTTLAAPNANCALSMIPFAIVLGEDKKDFSELCLYLCEPSSVIAKSDIMILGMLSAQVLGCRSTHIPKWLSIHNQEYLCAPHNWKPEVEKRQIQSFVHFPPSPQQKETQLRLF